MSDTARPKAGEVEERQAPAISVEGKKIRGRIPYGVESRDMGGWREIIEPTALRNARLDDLVATVDHVGVPIGRYPTTMDLEDRDDGLHWAVKPPESRADVREAVERGDLRAGSWRMIVSRERWDGDVRHVEAIDELRDVSVVSAPSYPGAAVEYRAAPTTNPADAPEKKDNDMSDTTQNTEETVEETRSEEKQEARVVSEPAPQLQVEHRADSVQFQSVADEFRSRGFPSEPASMGWDEFRAVTYGGGTVTDLNQVRNVGVGLGHDQRYAFPAFPSVAVDSGVTSVQTFRQSSRTLLAGTAVLRDIDAVSTKPEVDTAAELVTLPLQQVAAIESGIPNILLEQGEINSLVETDLRLQLNEGFDALVNAAVADADNQAPSTDELLVSIRKSITTIQGDGYQPDTLILTPANAEALDVLVTGNGGDNDYVFGPASAAPGTIFGLNVRVSKTVAAPVIVDANAFGRLYVAAVRLSRWEESAGQTNTSTVRLETNAAFSAERLDAAIRVAGS